MKKLDRRLSETVFILLDQYFRTHLNEGTGKKLAELRLLAKWITGISSFNAELYRKIASLIPVEQLIATE